MAYIGKKIRDPIRYAWFKANGVRKEKQVRQMFVRKVAPTLLEDARKSLIALLSETDDRVTPYMKDQIYEAICLDNDLRANRMVSESLATVPSHFH